jgi:hypothetical protein
MDEDPLVSAKEAAELLDTSLSVIGKWAKWGTLTRVRRNRTSWYYLSEINHIKNVRRRYPLKWNSEQLVMLEVEMDRLSYQVRQIQDQLGMPNKLVAFTDKELGLWYDQAVTIVKTEMVYPSFDFRLWLEFMKNLFPDELRRLQIIKNDPDAYTKFIALCDLIIDRAKDGKHPKRKKPNLRLAQVAPAFVMVRNQLDSRGASLFTKESREMTSEKLSDIAISLTKANLAAKEN